MGKKISRTTFTLFLLSIFGCLNSNQNGDKSIMKTVEYHTTPLLFPNVKKNALDE